MTRHLLLRRDRSILREVSVCRDCYREIEDEATLADLSFFVLERVIERKAPPVVEPPAPKPEIKPDPVPDLSAPLRLGAKVRRPA
jgi:hypothetical protein